MNGIGVRSSWQVLYTSLLCLVIRDIQKKFINNVRSTRAFGFVWIFLTPLMHVAVWIIVREIMTLNLGQQMPLPLFILLGVMPYMLMSASIGKSATQFISNKGLYMFRQIKPIDTVFSLVVSEFLVLVANYLLLLIFFWWISIKWVLHNPFLLFSTLFSFMIFTLGFSLILAVVGFFVLFIRRILSTVTRFLYLISGVFIPEYLVPEPIMNVMSFNPLFQCIALSRQAFSASSPFQSVASISYLWICAVVALFLGLMTYLAFRQKIMAEIEQR
jgi:capsular polysaccharide transport system permease protein